MSQRQLAFPRTLQQSLSQTVISMNSFTGMNSDDPASQIGAGDAVSLINLIAYGNYADARTGCRELMNVKLPALKLNNGTEVVYSASKSGTAVTVTESWLDVAVRNGDYFRWQDGTLDQITEKTAEGFTSLFSETRAGTDNQNCRVVGQLFGAFYHDKSKRIYLQSGNRIYYIDNAFSAYSEVVFVGGLEYADGEYTSMIGRSQSLFRPSDSDIAVFNDDGIYRIAEEPFVHYFMVNASNPQQPFDEVEQTSAKTFGRQVTYSLSRIINGSNAASYNGGRLGEGNSLLQESSPTGPADSTRRDTAKVFTEKPVGIGNELVTRIYSKDDITNHVTTTVGTWVAYGATGAFKISYNGAAKNYSPDFTNCLTMSDVAAKIQDAFAIGGAIDATCRYLTSAAGNAQLMFDVGEGNVFDGLVVAPDIAFVDITGDMFMGVGDGELVNYQAKFPVAYSAANPPEDADHFTHVTLWGTLDIGPAGVALGNKTEKLIWVKDVPLIRTLNCAFDGDQIIRESGNLLYQEDLGNMVTLFNGQSVQMIDLVNSGGDILYQETANRASHSGGLTATFRGPAAIGARAVAKGTQSDGTITIDMVNAGEKDDGGWIPEAGVFSFTESDVGKIIFTQDGGLRHITRWNSEISVDVAETDASYDFADKAIAWDFVNSDNDRVITDNTTDKTLATRGRYDDFLLQTRFYTPLPSSKIGELSNNFMLVAPPNSTIMYYCAVPLGKKQRWGYHNPGSQLDDNSEDVITYIKRFADRVVTFCRRTTFGTSTSTINSIDEPDIGEKVFLLPHVSLIETIGLVHTGSIQDVGIGQVILVTHEPQVRMFDGRQYGQANLADRQVMKYIKKISKVCHSSYDAINGYRLFCTLQENSSEASRVNGDTGLCLRLALNPSQGNRWSIFSGAEMVFPIANTNGIRFENEGEYLLQVALDTRTGLWYDISPYEGPEGSGLVQVWTDKATTEAPGGTEIQPAILVREDRKAQEHEQLEFLVSNVYLRPHPTSVDAEGNPVYRTGFSVSVKVFNDGRVVYAAQTKNVPVPGDVTFDRKTQGPRIQLEYTFGTSQMRLIGVDRIYAAFDRAGNQANTSRSTNELDYQREFADQALWLTRGRQPTLNRSIGNLATGDGPVAQIAGPDGLASSAMEFDGIEAPLEAETFTELTGDFTIQFGVKLQESPATIPPDSSPPDVSAWEDMDKIGSETTFIAVNMAMARFEFVVNGIARAWLKSGVWESVEPAPDPAVTEMGPYYDQDRSCWVFWMAGAVAGVLDGNNQANNFLTALPGTYNPTLFSYIHFNDEDGRIEFWTMTSIDAQPRITGYIDATGPQNGAP